MSKYLDALTGRTAEERQLGLDPRKYYRGTWSPQNYTNSNRSGVPIDSYTQELMREQSLRDEQQSILNSALPEVKGSPISIEDADRRYNEYLQYMQSGLKPEDIKFLYEMGDQK